MSCSSDSTRNNDIKIATYYTLSNIYKYTNNSDFVPENINNPFKSDFNNKYPDINTNLEDLEDVDDLEDILDLLFISLLLSGVIDIVFLDDLISSNFSLFILL